jgi:hypothetical protein
MAIRTHMQKSGEKHVVNKKRSNVAGRLNRAARAVSTGEAADLSPGAQTETLGAYRKATKERSVVLENRRRRHWKPAGIGE